MGTQFLVENLVFTILLSISEVNGFFGGSSPVLRLIVQQNLKKSTIPQKSAISQKFMSTEIILGYSVCRIRAVAYLHNYTISA